MEILRIIAINRGVEVVTIPTDSRTLVLSQGNDYVDAFRVETNSDDSVMALIREENMAGGRLIYQTDTEIIFKGNAPGLQYYASYHLSTTSTVSHLTLSTVVFYENWLGKFYFSIVRIFHKRAVPFMVWSVFGK